MPATTPGRCRLGSATRTFSTRCGTPSWHRTGSKTSGDRRFVAIGVTSAAGAAAPRTRPFRTFQVYPKSAAGKHAQALALSIGHISRLWQQRAFSESVDSARTLSSERAFVWQHAGHEQNTPLIRQADSAAAGPQPEITHGRAAL